MKKTELRKLIRKSIKGLMTEAPHPEWVSHKRLFIKVCDSAASGNSTLSSTSPIGSTTTYIQTYGIQCNGQLCTPSDIGKTFTFMFGFPTPLPFSKFILMSLHDPMTVAVANYSMIHQAISSNCGSPTWDCKPGWKPGVGGSCVSVPSSNGQFATKQDCIQSGCEPLHGGPKNSSTLPSLPKMTEPDDEISRMQDLANIKR